MHRARPSTPSAHREPPPPRKRRARRHHAAATASNTTADDHGARERGLRGRWPDASGAFATPQSIKEPRLRRAAQSKAPPATPRRARCARPRASSFYGGSRPLRHCLCVIDARDGRDAAVQAHERLAQILDDSICVCALVCAVDRPRAARSPGKAPFPISGRASSGSNGAPMPRRPSRRGRGLI